MKKPINLLIKFSLIFITLFLFTFSGTAVAQDVEAEETDPNGCNALGVCLEVEMEAISLQ